MASKSNKEMSEWIKFFTAAGIPPGPAAKYAMAFIDNRINKGMLMDLTKEYLKDMGISIMGDVICILKHAKSAHSQYERERPLLEAMPQPEDGKIELKRQTTPGNRMLEHYMRKEGIMEENTKVKVSTAMATRLGAVPTMGTKKKVVGVPESVEVIPVKKARRVPPEEEGSYVISMPKGSTERTKKILDQRVKDTKSSVFARLGGGSASTALSAATATGGKTVKKTKPAGLVKQADSATVFNRLGSQKTLSPASPALQYQGVLKSSPRASPTPKVAVAASKPLPVVKPLTVGIQERLGVQRPEVSTTTQTHMDAIGLKHSLQARLGGQKPAAPAASAQKKTVALRRDSAAGAPQKTPGVLARLGAQTGAAQPAAAAGASQALKRGLTRRLGAQTAPGQGATAPRPEPKARVLARLGRKQKAAAPVKVAAGGPRAGRVQKRLGLPVRAAKVKERLGLQKAEASSTTPTFTVTMGATPTAGQDVQAGSARKRKRKPASLVPEDSALRSVSMGQGVFSRLGSE